MGSITPKEAVIVVLACIGQGLTAATAETGLLAHRYTSLHGVMGLRSALARGVFGIGLAKGRNAAGEVFATENGAEGVLVTVVAAIVRV